MTLGYRINYEMEKGLVVNTYNRKKKKPYQILAGALIFLLILIGVAVKNDRTLMKYLLPGNYIVTERAISTFVEDIKGGGSFSGAVTAFCKEIINNETLE